VSLVEQRRCLVNDRVRTTNRLRNTLKQYYPQPLQWFDRIDTPLFCAFIERWPTLVQVKCARRTTLQRFFHQHNMRRAHVLEARLSSIKAASPLTLDEAVITPHRLQALVLVDLLRVTLAAIKRFDEAIAELAPQHPDYGLFSPLPGAGTAFTGRLWRATGALQKCGRGTKICGYRPGHRAQWQEALGTLAMAVSNLPAPDLCGVGRTNH